VKNSENHEYHKEGQLRKALEAGWESGKPISRKPPADDTRNTTNEAVRRYGIMPANRQQQPQQPFSSSRKALSRDRGTRWPARLGWRVLGVSLQTGGRATDGSRSGGSGSPRASVLA